MFLLVKINEYINPAHETTRSLALTTMSKTTSVIEIGLFLTQQRQGAAKTREAVLVLRWSGRPAGLVTIRGVN